MKHINKNVFMRYKTSSYLLTIYRFAINYCQLLKEKRRRWCEKSKTTKSITIIFGLKYKQIPERQVPFDSKA